MKTKNLIWWLLGAFLLYDFTQPSRGKKSFLGGLFGKKGDNSTTEQLQNEQTQVSVSQALANQVQSFYNLLKGVTVPNEMDKALGILKTYKSDSALNDFRSAFDSMYNVSLEKFMNKQMLFNNKRKDEMNLHFSTSNMTYRFI